MLNRAKAHAVQGLLQVASAGDRIVRFQQRNAPRTQLSFYHQPGDPHSELLAQRLSTLARHYDVAIDVVLVGAPEVAATPEPELRAAWAIEDAKELARHYLLDFADSFAQPSKRSVQLAAAILAGSSDSAHRLAMTDVVRRPLFTDDTSTLSALAAAEGAVSAAEARRVLADGSERLRRAGHYWGGMLHDGFDWYWGIDRLHHLAERLERLGARRPRDDDELLEPLLPERDPPRALPQPVAAGPDTPIEVFFSFRSPYSYLAVAQLAELERRTGARVVLRPVLPMVTRGLPVLRNKKLYIVRDSDREARALGIPFGLITDPLGEGVERCAAVWHAHRDEPAGRRFVEAACRAIWSEACDVASDAGLLRVTREVGITDGKARAALESDAWRDTLEANRRDLVDMGLWGVPCFRYGDYTCWGRDRMPLLEARVLEAKRSRSSAAQQPEPAS